MNADEDMLQFYKFIMSERCIRKEAAVIMLAETEKMILTTNAMAIHSMMACLQIQKGTNSLVRIGIYLFTMMNWVPQVGYTMFPLSDSGYAGTFQDVMHMAATAAAYRLIHLFGNYLNHLQTAPAFWMISSVVFLLIARSAYMHYQVKGK